MTARRKGRRRARNRVVRLPVRFKSSAARTDAEKYQAALELQQQKQNPDSASRREDFGGKSPKAT